MNVARGRGAQTPIITRVKYLLGETKVANRAYKTDNRPEDPLPYSCHWQGNTVRINGIGRLRPESVTTKICRWKVRPL